MFSSDTFHAFLLLAAFVVTSTSAQSSCYNQPLRGYGKCIVLTECPYFYQILRDTQRTELEADQLRRSTCGTPARVPNVCCTSAPPAPVQPKPGNNNGESLLPEKCGKTAGSDRIVGGKETSLDAYPWLTLVEYKDKLRNEIRPLCGGSIITARYVLTAAHCITVDQRDYSAPLRVRLGEHDLRTLQDCRVVNDEGDEDCNDPPVFIAVESYEYHEGYRVGEKSGHNDIGLLRLAQHIQWTDFIKPICLPSPEVMGSLSAGYDVFAAGWGRTENASKSEVKLDIEIQMTSLATCQSAYNRWRVQLFNGQICAGGQKGVDTCSGDSGGPLMAYLERSLTWQIVGIVSFGPNYCGQAGVPGVYANVGYYLDWIKSHLKP